MCRHVRLRSIDFICIFSAVLGALLAVALGCSILREYLLTQEYIDAKCTVTSITWTENQPCLACYTTHTSSSNYEGSYLGTTRSRCSDSSFPCAHVIVRVHLEDEEESPERVGQLHASATQLTGEFSNCSYDVCRHSLSYNHDMVDRFVDPYEELQNNQKKIDCYFTRDNPTRLIPERKYSFPIALHAVLWPALLFIFCTWFVCVRLIFCQNEKFLCETCLAKCGFTCFSAENGDQALTTDSVLPPPIGGAGFPAAPPSYEYAQSSTPGPYLSLSMNLPSYEQAVGTSLEEIPVSPPPYAESMETGGDQSPAFNISGVLAFQDHEETRM